MPCAPSEDSDQPGHLSSLIRVFTVRMKKAWVLRYPLSAQRRFCSDWADAQADLSLRWAHSHFIGFVTMRLISDSGKSLLNGTITQATDKMFVIRDPCDFSLRKIEPPHDKINKMTVRPAKTQISLGIRPV